MPKRRNHTRSHAAAERRVDRRLDTELHHSRERARLERELLNDESYQESPIRIPREKREKSSARDAKQNGGHTGESDGKANADSRTNGTVSYFDGSSGSVGMASTTSDPARSREGDPSGQRRRSFRRHCGQGPQVGREHCEGEPRGEGGTTGSGSTVLGGEAPRAQQRGDMLAPERGATQFQ